MRSFVTQACIYKDADSIAQIFTATTHQDVVDSSRSHSVNGDVRLEESSVPNTEGSESVLGSADVSINGSDNEAAKGSGDGQGHSRSTSTLKKPNFKAVSVNKTFLAKGASPVQSQPFSTPSSDRQSAAVTTTLKPRFVAKSGGLREAVVPANTTGGTAPAASAVWNKNRRMYGTLC